jgi:hypothetical protein
MRTWLQTFAFRCLQLVQLYGAVGAWLVQHPAPQWLVNSPLKTRATELLAGSSYDPEQSVADVKRLIASDDVVVGGGSSLVTWTTSILGLSPTGAYRVASVTNRCL